MRPPTASQKDWKQAVLGSTFSSRQYSDSRAKATWAYCIKTTTRCLLEDWKPVGLGGLGIVFSLWHSESVPPGPATCMHRLLLFFFF